MNHKQTLEEIKKKGLYRTLRAVSSEQGPKITIGGRQVLLFSSNNYLDLASHPSIKAAAAAATAQYGFGSGASRLICGNSELYSKLEDRLASFKKIETSLVFSCGYMANMGVISSLFTKGDLILSDRFNHASIIDGCLLSRAKVIRYPHNDVEAIEQILKKSSSYKNKLIVTDAVFSMDGDIANLPEIITVANRYCAQVMVDEAHAIGALGRTGRGICEYFSLTDSPLIVMGTFGKAFGGYGAYVAGSLNLRKLLINKCRNVIFTTALPPAVLNASIAAIDLVEKQPHRVHILQSNALYIRNGLKNLGFNILQSNTHIIPVMIGDPVITMKISKRLLTSGIFIQGIRPPSVPKATSRLRLTTMASHTKDDINFLLESFKKVGTEFGLI